MTVLDRLFHRSRTLEEPSVQGQGDMDQVIEIAERVVPKSEELAHFFIVSGNPSVIEAYHGLLRVGCPAYGGWARLYHASDEALSACQSDAETKGLRFAGQRAMGSTVEEMRDLVDVLASLRRESGEVSIAYAAVGPTGLDWVGEVYTTVMGEAAGQGILPFYMYSTTDEAAAKHLLSSFTAVSD